MRINFFCSMLIEVMLLGQFVSCKEKKSFADYMAENEVLVMDKPVTIYGDDVSEIFFNVYEDDYPNFLSNKTEGCRIVTLDPFIMGKYEVTQELYKTVMKGHKIMLDGQEYELDSSPSVCVNTSDSKFINPCKSEVEYLRPVENVTWYDAVYFCNCLSEKRNLKSAYFINVKEIFEGHIVDADVIWDKNTNGYRLPTEAEWEFAARGGNPDLYEWNHSIISGGTIDKIPVHHGYQGEVVNKLSSRDGDLVDELSFGVKGSVVDDFAWYEGNITKRGGRSDGDYIQTKEEAIKAGKNFNALEGFSTHQVGLKKPNRLGIYDMSGNVEEFCYDFYSYYVKTMPRPWMNSVAGVFSYSDEQKKEIMELMASDFVLKPEKVVNPSGPSTGYTRVVRGGSWLNWLGTVDSLFKRDYCESDGFGAGHRGAGPYLGFRVVRTVK